MVTWLLAVVAVCYTMAISWLLMTLARGNEDVALSVALTGDGGVGIDIVWNHPWKVLCVAFSVVIWVVGVLILTIPIGMYMVTFSLPSDSDLPLVFQNMTHLSDFLSMYFTIMSSTLIPMWTRKVSASILRVLDIDDENKLKQHKLSNVMSICARTTATIIIPVAICFYFNDGWWARFPTYDQMPSATHHLPPSPAHQIVELIATNPPTHQPSFLSMRGWTIFWEPCKWAPMYTTPPYTHVHEHLQPLNPVRLDTSSWLLSQARKITTSTSLRT